MLLLLILLTWPMLGGTPERHMTAPDAKNVSTEFDPATGHHILWKADLGTRCYTQPVIASGKVLIGTNNEKPRNKRDTRKDADGDTEPLDKAILMCFEAKTGQFLWQAVHDRPTLGGVGHWPREGLVSTPCVDDDKAYYVSPAGVVTCVDLNGFADGNQGLQGEKYATATDADILWQYSLPKELNVSPHVMASCSPVIVGDRLFLVTGNGVDEGHVSIPSPEAPSFIALNKKTSQLLWKDNSPGKNILHGQWSSPAYTETPVPQMIFPGGDGFLYGLDPATGKHLWKFNANLPGAKYELGGTGEKCDFLASPVIHDGCLYVGTGQDPEHFSGPANFWCLDLRQPLKNGQPVVKWHFGGKDERPGAQREFRFGRTMSNALVVGDLVYLAELGGYLHVLNRNTGEPLAGYDTKSCIWASPFYADGKVFLPTEYGNLFIFNHLERLPKLDYPFSPLLGGRQEQRAELKRRLSENKQKLVLREIDFDRAMRSSLSISNNVLYIATERTLYAVKRL